MGILGKYAAYRWVSSGRGDGGGDGGTVLAIVFVILVVVVGVLWAVGKVLSFVWGLIYGLVHPVLAVFPPVTVPLAVILVGWLFTRIGPYSAEKTEAYLDGTGDNLSFAARSVWAIIAINVWYLVFGVGAFPDGSGVVGLLFAVVVALLGLYGIYELVHLPYRCIRLLLHAPGGARHVIAYLSPILFVFVSAAFDAPLAASFAFPVNVDAAMAVDVVVIALVNWLCLGGALAVLWKQDAIRAHGIIAARRDNRGERERTATSTVESTPEAN